MMPVSAARLAAFEILLRVQEQGAYASELLNSEGRGAHPGHGPRPLSPADHGLCVELVMGTLRWQSALDRDIEAVSSQKLNRIDAEVLIALRLGAYQLRFLDRVPARAAVHESVELVKRARKKSAAPFANAVLRKLAGKRGEAALDGGEAAVAAHPTWLVERWVGEFGAERAHRICQFDQQAPALALRMPAKGAEELEARLRAEGIELSPGRLLRSARVVLSDHTALVVGVRSTSGAKAPGELGASIAGLKACATQSAEAASLRASTSGSKGTSELGASTSGSEAANKLGDSVAGVRADVAPIGNSISEIALEHHSIFEIALRHHLTIQDEGSQLVAALVGTGTRILDCCAAPGNKTTALAEANPEANIVAVELHPHRAEQLRRRLAGLATAGDPEAAGAVRTGKIEVLTADATALPYGREFDRILADVPCSGTGTLARNPEIKWKLRREDLGDLHARQKAILGSALRHLAAGGVLIYSTCSLEAEENAAVIEEVLGEYPEAKLLDCRARLDELKAAGELTWPDLDSLTSGPFLQTLPGTHPCDGFFAAMISI
jgi:16S rRNA C967 or C1407 C5-methylase (RsmB/RsmF family)